MSHSEAMNVQHAHVELELTIVAELVEHSHN